MPPDFRFGFKATDDITLRKFPNLPRFGPKAGLPNPDFLNADLYASAFLKPCEAFALTNSPSYLETFPLLILS